MSEEQALKCVVVEPTQLNNEVQYYLEGAPSLDACLQEAVQRLREYRGAGYFQNAELRARYDGYVSVFTDQPKSTFEVSVACVEEFAGMLDLAGPAAGPLDASKHEQIVEFLMAFCVGRVTGLCAMLAPPQEADAAAADLAAVGAAGYGDQALLQQQGAYPPALVAPMDAMPDGAAFPPVSAAAGEDAAAVPPPQLDTMSAAYMQQVLAQTSAMQVYLQSHSVSSEALFADFDPSTLTLVRDDDGFEATVPSALEPISAGVAETANNGITVLRIAELEKLRPFVKDGTPVSGVEPKVLDAYVGHQNESKDSWRWYALQLPVALMPLEARIPCSIHTLFMPAQGDRFRIYGCKERANMVLLFVHRELAGLGDAAMLPRPPGPVVPPPPGLAPRMGSRGAAKAQHDGSAPSGGGRRNGSLAGAHGVPRPVQPMARRQDENRAVVASTCSLMRDIMDLVASKKNKYVHKKSDRAWRIEPHLPKDRDGDSNAAEIARTRLAGHGLLTSPELGGLFREMLVCSTGERWWSCISETVRKKLKRDLDVVRSKLPDAAALAACKPYLNFPERLDDYKNYINELEAKWLDTLRRRGWNYPTDFGDASQSSQDFEREEQAHEQYEQHAAGADVPMPPAGVPNGIIDHDALARPQLPLPQQTAIPLPPFSAVGAGGDQASSALPLSALPASFAEELLTWPICKERLFAQAIAEGMIQSPSSGGADSLDEMSAHLDPPDDAPPAAKRQRTGVHAAPRAGAAPNADAPADGSPGAGAASDAPVGAKRPLPPALDIEPPTDVQLLMAHGLCAHWADLNAAVAAAHASKQPLEEQADKLAAEEAALRARLAEVEALRVATLQRIAAVENQSALAATDRASMRADAQRLTRRRAPHAYLAHLAKFGQAELWKELLQADAGKGALFALALHQQLGHSAAAGGVPAPLPATLDGAQQLADPAAADAADPASAYYGLYNPLLYTAAQLGMTDEQHAAYLSALGLTPEIVAAVHAGDSAAIAQLNETVQAHMAMQGYGGLEGLPAEYVEQYNAYMAMQGWVYTTPEGHTVQVHPDGSHTYVDPAAAQAAAPGAAGVPAASPPPAAAERPPDVERTSSQDTVSAPGSPSHDDASGPQPGAAHAGPGADTAPTGWDASDARGDGSQFARPDSLLMPPPPPRNPHNLSRPALHSDADAVASPSGVPLPAHDDVFGLNGSDDTRAGLAHADVGAPSCVPHGEVPLALSQGAAHDAVVLASESDGVAMDPPPWHDDDGGLLGDYLVQDAQGYEKSVETT